MSNSTDQNNKDSDNESNHLENDDTIIKAMEKISHKNEDQNQNPTGEDLEEEEEIIFDDDQDERVNRALKRLHTDLNISP